MDIRIQRDSRFEFLRLISIFAIVLHHLVIHTSVLTLPPLTFNRTVAQLFDIGGKVGVNCFILITGYFQCCSSFKSITGVFSRIKTNWYWSKRNAGGRAPPASLLLQYEIVFYP